MDPTWLDTNPAALAALSPTSHWMSTFTGLSPVEIGAGSTKSPFVVSLNPSETIG